MKIALFIFSLFSLFELTLELGFCKAQSLTSPSIHSYKHTSIGLRTKDNAQHQHISGTGTSTAPYVLYDALDVDSIRYLGMNAKYYELGNDIDLSQISEFIPIPNDDNNGVFSLDGKGFTLSGLNQTNGIYSSQLSSYCLGMFAGRSGSGTTVIKNLIVDGFRINMSSSVNLSGTYFTGAVLFSAITNGYAQFTNIIIRNSSLKFTGNPDSYPSQSLHGMLIGLFSPLGTEITYISKCTAEYDTIYFSSTATPNSGHFIGGLVGKFANANTLTSFEFNTSRYNYFYSRVFYTIRTNCGGGLIGEVSSSASTFRYNYSHSNKADFGNGGSPNNFPWGWGGIFGYTYANNIHTFQQNYAANNECLGTNQSGGLFAEDNSTTTGQVFDSTLNFCDITSFAKPNTVYGSVRYAASQYPSAKTSAQLKDINTFTGWDFTNIWSIDSTKNNGYPYQLSNE